ncbi:MAG: type II CRISPR RNA-guided endonuclease Cas9 [Anaerohalosphaeraceae bacterium]
MGYILGIDLGPTSIGWAAFDLDENNEPVTISTILDKDEKGNWIKCPALGARVFPAGVDNLGKGKQESPKNLNRRLKRSLRRRLRRAKARRKAVVELLIKYGLLKDLQHVETIQQVDPYEIRARAASSKVELFEIARIFLHFAKRRGFKSNRRQPLTKEKNSSEMKEAIERLDRELDGKTLGQFWYERRTENPRTAIRNRRDQYRWIAQRKHYIDELTRIWTIQAPYYPAVLTKEFYDELTLVLFAQIPFELSNRKKKKIIGTCELITGKPRCPWAERAAQKFRLLQKVNDLLVDGYPLSPRERKVLIELLTVKKELSFDQIREKLWGPEGAKKKFNLQYKTNDKMLGNEIDSLLVSAAFFDKNRWLNLEESHKDEVWRILREFLDEKRTKQQVEAVLANQYGLHFKRDEWPEKLKEPEGYCAYSREALEKILPALEQGKNLYEAVQQAGFSRKMRQLNFLPLPVKENGFSIPNPVVRSVLVQLRKVINLLIKEKGVPTEIVVETAAPMKASKLQRQEILENQAKNQQERDKARQAIREMMGWEPDVDISETDVLKYRLWKSQKEYCPYTCRKIPSYILFTREVEIDHILPYSMSLDNSLENKVVCFASANQDKKQNTPISWLGEHSERWEQICEFHFHNAFGFTDEKWDRFCTRNEEIAEKYQNKRLLQDTAYAARVIRSYLQQLYPPQEAEYRVRTTKGGITAELRNLWGLNAVLRDGGAGPKNREDLRHHAVDAAVVALTKPALIQKITKTLQQNWPQRPSLAPIAEPWEDFRNQLKQAVQSVNISHRVQRKVKGALHQETNYFLEENGLWKGKYITRRQLAKITQEEAERICDPHIRGLVRQRLYEYDGDAAKAFETPLLLRRNPDIPIYSVRIWNTLSNPILIRESSGETLRPFTNKVWVKSEENHHIEFYKAKNAGGKTVFLCLPCSMWQAAQRIKNKQPIILKRFLSSDYQNAEFIMSLSKGETVWMKGKSGQVCLVRVTGISGDPENPKKIDMEAKPIHLADVRLEGEQKNALRREWRLTDLQRFPERILQKVTIDPLGRIRRAND